MTEKTPSELPLSFFERIQTSPWFDTMIHKRKEIGYAILGIVCLTALTVWLMARSEKNQIEEYELASLYAEKLEKPSSLFENQNYKEQEEEAVKTSDELFASLLKLAKEAPIVKARFNGVIAQEYLLRDNAKEAEPYAQKAIATLKASNLSYYAQFSEISYLTCENRLNEALELVRSLQTQKEFTAQTTLYACTLLQQAALESALGSKENAEQTITKLKALLHDTETDIAKFINHTKDKQNSLLNFLLQPNSK